MNQPLAPTQKKIDNSSPQTTDTPDQSSIFYAEFSEEIEELIAARTKESHWLVPIIVFMVVGATIYLAVLNNKVEYVYSLASACFGFYFGQITPRPISPPKKSLERL